MAVFVDTGAWYAISVPSDPDHAAASEFMRSNRERLVTSDYIYDELLTLFRARGHIDRGCDWVNQARQQFAKTASKDAWLFLPRRLIGFGITLVAKFAEPIVLLKYVSPHLAQPGD